MVVPMHHTFRLASPLVGLALFALCATPAGAYIDIPPPTLGDLCFTSRHIYVLEVEKASVDHGVILFKTGERLKAAKDTVDDAAKHVVGKDTAGAKVILDWATAKGTAKTAVFFTAHEYAYVYFDNYWYKASHHGKGEGECWRVAKGDPAFLTRFCGTPKELRNAVVDILDKKTVEVPCMASDDKAALAERRGKVQVLRASHKLRDYDPKRDFVKWASEK